MDKNCNYSQNKSGEYEMKVSKTKLYFATPHSLGLDIVMSINEHEASNIQSLSKEEKDELCMMWGQQLMHVVKRFDG